MVWDWVSYQWSGHPTNSETVSDVVSDMVSDVVMEGGVISNWLGRMSMAVIS